MEETSQELVARAIALVRRTADARRTVKEATAIGEEARAIVAMLPEPVDPDLVEARVAVASYYEGVPGSAARLAVMEIMSGKDDRTITMQCAVLAIKRGRELAKARAGEGAGE